MDEMKIVIDTHVHCFPDKLAERAIPELSARANLPPYSDGTVDGTKELCRSCGVDRFVLLNIATKPKQQKTVNDWAISLVGDPVVIPFGSIHPLCEDKIDELQRLKYAGIKGIKLHPDYQSFFVDDPEMDGVYAECGRLGLVVAFHAGLDLGLPETVHAPPERLAVAVRRHPETTFVIAHLGGYRCWDGVLEHLVGISNIYFDTAYCARFMPIDIAEKVIRAHGADKILFASDLPWESPAQTKEFIQKLDIPKLDKQKIITQNAARLLGF